MPCGELHCRSDKRRKRVAATLHRSHQNSGEDKPMTPVRFKNLATPTEKTCLPRAGRQIGVRGRKTRPNGSLVGSGVIGPAARRTDAQSGVFWSPGQVSDQCATDFATELAFEALSGPGQGGGGPNRHGGGRIADPFSVTRNF